MYVGKRLFSVNRCLHSIRLRRRSLVLSYSSVFYGNGYMPIFTGLVHCHRPSAQLITTDG
jgi:hypothetical protein